MCVRVRRVGTRHDDDDDHDHLHAGGTQDMIEVEDSGLPHLKNLEDRGSQWRTLTKSGGQHHPQGHGEGCRGQEDIPQCWRTPGGQLSILEDEKGHLFSSREQVEDITNGLSPRKYGLGLGPLVMSSTCSLEENK